MKPGSAEAYVDRPSAGRALVRQLADLKGKNVVVLGLPRGGVPVAAEVAKALRAPLDVCLVRKLGVPWHEELAMGALGDGGVWVIDRALMLAEGVGDDELHQVVAREARELERRKRLYREDREPEPIAGRIALLVDDGLATGASMRAAVKATRQRQPAELWVAVPVASREAVDLIAKEADRVVCPLQPPRFLAVGAWYRDFAQTDDAEVAMLLAEAAERAL